MRPHGRASIDPRKPRALGICQRCGFMYNHDQLRWQYEYGGMRLINERIIVCQSCYDTPQIQLRTIILPPDPVPVEYPVPEVYTSADNPISGIEFSPRELLTVGSSRGAPIGDLTYFAGLNSAFDGNIRKQSWRSAVKSVSASSFSNTIGRYWNYGMTATTNPSSVIQSALTYEVSSFSVYAPLDKPLSDGGAVGLRLEGSNDAITWTTLYSTTTAGTNGESVTSVSSNLTGGNYQYHRINILGDGISQISVSQVKFNVSNTGQNEQ